MSFLTDSITHANEFMHSVNEVFILIIEVLIYLFGIIGIVVLSAAVIKSFHAYMQHKSKDQLQINLAKGMQLSLQFLLSCEILHTIISDSWDGILVVGGIIALRFALNFTIHWETKGLEHGQMDGHGHVDLHTDEKKVAKL